MKHLLLSVSIVATAMSLSACESLSGSSQGGAFRAASEAPEDPRSVQIVEMVKPLPLPGQLKRLPKGSASKTAAAAALPPQQAVRKGTRAATLEPTVEGYVNAVQVYPYTEGALYRVYAAPDQVTDIALQPGEKLISVSAGDTVRWVVGDTTSGQGETEQARVLVKPIRPLLKTNLVISTDRRSYHLELESTADTYMAALSWTYPNDQLMALKKRNDRAASREERTVERDLKVDDLNFAYRIEGDATSWRPVRVFDDGRQVFIQMPADLARGEAPPLFILGPQGDAQLVNYRLRGRYYVVDRLFAEAELRLGKRSQQVVRITRMSEARS
jgi:type IV secretion system protein VirB9